MFTVVASGRILSFISHTIDKPLLYENLIVNAATPCKLTQEGKQLFREADADGDRFTGTRDGVRSVFPINW